MSIAEQSKDPAYSGGQLAERYAEGDIVAGKYVLIRKLGSGGMGDVWLAHNRALDCRVAIKFISAEFAPTEAAEAGLVEQLLEEARASAGLDHPAIVRVFDFGRTSKGDPMIVMQYLEGEDLATALETHERTSPVRVVRVLLPVIHGLAAAHARGIVHRDVKPDNIFLCRDESGRIQPKLFDFGIAKRQSRAPSASRLTRTGIVVGCPTYMSPEQAQGREVNARSDVWAICVVLYELIAGQPPFDADDVTAQLDKVINDEADELTGFDGAEQLWPIVARGLAKDPADRWPSMIELGKQLARWALEQGAREDMTGVSLESTWFAGHQDVGNVLVSLPPPPENGKRSHGGLGSEKRRRPTPGRAAAPSEPELEALAELHSGGDPVNVMARHSRRKAITVAVLLCAFAVSIVLVVLVGAGALRR